MVLVFYLEYSKGKGGDKVDLEPWIDEFVTFFLAGQDTTSNLLAFVVLELTQNPLIMEK